MYRDRLGLSPADIKLLAEAGNAPPAPALAGTFAGAWRNYLKSIFRRGFWYKLSCSPSSPLYICENKTLAGKEDRSYEGDALGRKLAVTFFEEAGGGLVQRVERAHLGLAPRLLTVAEILQSCGAPLANPARTAAEAETLFEAQFMNLDIWRLVGTLDTDADDVHMYSLGDEVLAETAYAAELKPQQRTKMVLARCLQRHAALKRGETLQAAWALPLQALQRRAAPFLGAPAPAQGPGPALAAPPAPVLLDAPPVPPALVAPLALPVAGKGGRGRGKGRGRGRGQVPR